MKDRSQIPKATAKRLPLYYRFLKSLSDAGVIRVSSVEISESLQIDPATIRRDFSHFGALGKKGYGYSVLYLLEYFAEVLHQNEDKSVILVGVGHLGSALIRHNYEGLKQHGRICMGFDVHISEPMIGEIPIYHMDFLEEKIRAQQIEVAILTVPQAQAYPVALRLVNAGIRGILNFTSSRLNLPNVIIHDIDLTQELQFLLYLLTHYRV
ncbi:MAG TPA: redox-sensing transcriptional repressor Rex [Firmicutes bacterium]|nr:redox-sensing transcriptional repressor Rex [Bacillales bacterium]HJA40648.1 redox-sensing transcriptional repressor Rex [Bacillota bacterium]